MCRDYPLNKRDVVFLGNGKKGVPSSPHQHQAPEVFVKKKHAAFTGLSPVYGASALPRLSTVS
jgi:hypothetical protein